ncbi:hypothetical protein [Accumulibacter sp.]|jgi:glycosyltransferase involved in cell wall biosynthesis|uniref:Glycosyltransferase subfamily 4-like N-terminal domain-containing protein n=1 Tax=Accumulibacter regalis TaxID=522306 RepID=C7RVP1_ACCRE|nr:hypothetical protein [Accumulibacter sp.]MBN8496663.1 hypothetical protein [Accumulibacter sp.]MBO3716469.1 hypothetical protein [Accumulibacter sp.]
MKDLLIVGKIPPPIGGVTIHVSRLWAYFCSRRDCSFLHLKDLFTGRGISSVLGHRIIHLHTSNVYLRLVFAVVGHILGKRTIITYHGNLSRYSWLKNEADYLSLRWCSVPIVINRGSHTLARGMNPRAQRVSAFIPPSDVQPLPLATLEVIERIKLRQRVFCTNAFNVTFDKHGLEIYGITNLLSRFSLRSDYKLIISDPTGSYKAFVRVNAPDLIDVPHWICFPHDFCEVIKLSEGFIRNTSTDGDSISVREALYLGKPVFATNVVDRPEGVLAYRDLDELFALLQSGTTSNVGAVEPNTIEVLIDIYKELGLGREP